MPILRYWKPILAALVTAALAWVLHSWDVARIEAKNQAALKAQENAINVDCQAAKLFTYGNSYAYQTGLASDLSAVDQRYDSLVVRDQAAPICIALPGTGPGLDAAGTKGTGSVGTVGIPAAGVLKILKNGDQRIKRANRKLSACQAHVAEIERLK